MEMQWWAGFLTHDRFPMERIEIAIQHLHSAYTNAHRKRGATPIKLSEFMLFVDAWEYKHDSKDPNLNSDVDQIIKAFTASGAKVIVRKPGE